MHKSLIHRATHTIKFYLSEHFTNSTLKKLAFAISLITCICDGSILLFSLFASSLHNLAGLSYLSINSIASLSAFGMYLFLPLLGYLADCFGPALLSLIAIWLFVPGYFVNAYLVKQNANLEVLDQLSVFQVRVLSGSFFFIGLATSALYFLSLLTCAKIYPQHKSLAISLPVSCYGLSSLLGSQLLRLDYFKSPKNPLYLNLGRVFSFFGCLYLVMGTLNFVANSIVSMELDVIFADENSETRPLMERRRSRHSQHDVEDCSENDDGLVPIRLVVEPVNHHDRYMAFLLDKSAWVLLVSLVLNIGPLESFQNNMGSIIETTTGGKDPQAIFSSEVVLTLTNHIPKTNLSNQVGVMAASSTVARLFVGAIADYIASPERRYPICKMWILMVVIILGVVGQYMVTQQGVTEKYFTVVSVLNGSSYGGLFTVYPTVIASIWGIDMMGLTWGSFMVAPAVGLVVFSLFYGRENDLKCGKGSAMCLNTYFQSTAAGLAVSLLCVAVVWRMWWSRGFKMF